MQYCQENWTPKGLFTTHHLIDTEELVGVTALNLRKHQKGPGSPYQIGLLPLDHRKVKIDKRQTIDLQNPQFIFSLVAKVRTGNATNCGSFELRY